MCDRLQSVKFHNPFCFSGGSHYRLVVTLIPLMEEGFHWLAHQFQVNSSKINCQSGLSCHITDTRWGVVGVGGVLLMKLVWIVGIAFPSLT